MIDPKELRIGNLVMDAAPYDSIHAVDLNMLINAVGNGRQYRGIALTPEWLRRCGFEWDENRYDGETRIVRRGCLELHHDEDQPLTGYSIALFDDGNISFAGYDIRYLHQLQTLWFSLTGEELSIYT